jgi:hypothetical protein
MNSAKMKHAILCVGFGILALLVSAVAWNYGRTTSRSVFHTAERLTEQAHKEYASGSFQSATNALKAEVDYLERNRHRLAQVVRVDMSLKTAYSRLAYLLLHSSSEQEAARYTHKAFVHYNRTLAETPEKQVRPEDFMEHLLQGMDYIDLRTGAEWKSGITLNTNTLETVNALFLSEVQSPHTTASPK